jgi:hypothetical protein
MHLGYDIVDDGIAVSLDGRVGRFTYPEEIWRTFESKRELATELVFLTLYGVALGGADPTLRCDFPRPRFIDTYDRWFAATLPYLADVLETEPETLASERARLERRFLAESTAPWRFPETRASSAIASLTMGKDSLASLVVARKLELDVVAVHCQHPSLSDDFRIRLPAMRAAGEALRLAVDSVIDDVKPLGRTAQGHRSGILSSMSLAAYSLMLLPFAAFHRARHVLVGNEHELDHPMRARSGELVSLSPLQTVAGMGELDRWMAQMTSGQLRLTSPIQALHRLAGHALIHQVRPEVGAHQISCRRASAAQRWCGACKTCAESALFMAAVGRDPREVGLRLLLDEAHGEHYALLSHGLDPADPYRFRLAEQELLAFGVIAAAGEDTAVQRLVRQRYGARLETDRVRLERTYLTPVEPPSALPLAAAALACARQLLAERR